MSAVAFPIQNGVCLWCGEGVIQAGPDVGHITGDRDPCSTILRLEHERDEACVAWDAASDDRDDAQARVYELEAAATKVTDAYTAEAEDHNDGEFALWKADDLVNAIVALWIALAEEGA